MVDIVKPPCNSIIIHDFYTYPHLFFWDKFFPNVDLCAKKMNKIGITHFIFILYTYRIIDKQRLSMTFPKLYKE